MLYLYFDVYEMFYMCELYKKQPKYQGKRSIHSGPVIMYNPCSSTGPDMSLLSTAPAKCQNVESDGRAAAVSALSGVTSVQISQQGAMISLTAQRQGSGHSLAGSLINRCIEINHHQCSSASYTHNKILY